MERKSGQSKYMHFLPIINSQTKLNILEKNNVLEKVHILPIKKRSSNFHELYNKLNKLINEKNILYEGIVISLKDGSESSDLKISKIPHINEKEESIKIKNKINNDDVFGIDKVSTDESSADENQTFDVDIPLNDNDENNKNINNINSDIFKNKKDNGQKESMPQLLDNNVDYVIINCIPSKGILNHDTLIYTDGKYVDYLKKIEIIIINDINYKKYEKNIKRKFISLKKMIIKKSNEFFNGAMSLFPLYFNFIPELCMSKNRNKVSKNEQCSIEKIINLSTSDEYNTKKKETKKINKIHNIITQKILTAHLIPYFKNNRNKLFYPGKLFNVYNFSFLVSKIDIDISAGFIDDLTEINLRVDGCEAYTNVHIVPLYDTLPTTYNYNLFIDYIKPYIEKNYLNTFSIYDTFFYRGVQFKIMGVDPIDIKCGKGRISANTSIYIQGSVKPTFFDVISNKSFNYIKSLPFEYKPYAILNILQHLDTDSLLRLFPSANTNMEFSTKNEQNILDNLAPLMYIYNKENISYGSKLENKSLFQTSNSGDSKDIIIEQSNAHREINNNIDKSGNDFANKKCSSKIDNNIINEQCVVCFEHFINNDKCIKLTCFHTYHWKCVQNWFRFNLTCPCCRHKLDI
ncbi:RING zinc finger protein, putative [Plasmodium berghei]|uniref:RING-type E3 ubiquitin transferase n=2 Tax=Plasmodium berghei TaxID=5821 RepID=A0A509ALI1_PLABA|nr:RING zinc finger protein, putative [Plasmodium berghei ANKA]SCM24557.1 RING zinc finger protein, putative [Plasmodium berghei]SCN27099.1 RING zinc finger protein, putative [Plasmodium berghei]SCO63521.1 RING zinc finger protein, putative [Plasmodium berghei]VUC56954.1 RING zinc finger protein, putative [Plasmodium berghei ANKA]|eukprot:XP_034422733.1 RING zinc finger protein, putative [Plasmodium berghei ANKA]